MARAGEKRSRDAAGPPPDRLRRIRWALAAVLVAGAGLLAGIYFLQPKAAELDVPRVSLRVRETAHGFVLTRSEGGRTIFRLKAALATQMQSGEHTILEHVELVVFDRDGVHADRISGEQFKYDPASGRVVAVGEVRIALEGPRGEGTRGDRHGLLGGQPQEAPAGRAGKESSIVVTAKRLRFNTKTGTAEVGGGLDFRYWNAVGHADAARLEAGSNKLVMTGDVQLDWSPPGRPPLEVRAGEATLDKAARTITLAGASGGADQTGGQAADPLVTMGSRRLTARRLVLRLGPDDVVRAAEALGGVRAAASGNGRRLEATCERAWVWFKPGPARARRGPLRQPGARLTEVVASGNVVADVEGADGSRERLQGEQVTVGFGGDDVPTRAEAEQAALWLTGRGPHPSAMPQRAEEEHGEIGVLGLGGKRPGLNGGEVAVEAPALEFVFGPGAKAGQTAVRRVGTEGRGTVRYEPEATGQGAMRMAANRFEVALNGAQQVETAQADGRVEWNESATEGQGARSGTAARAQAWMNTRTGRVARVFENGGVSVKIAGAAHETADGTITRMGGESGTTGQHGQVAGSWGLGPGTTTVTGGTLNWDAESGVARLLPGGSRVTAASADGRIEASELALTPQEMIASGGVRATLMPAHGGREARAKRTTHSPAARRNDGRRPGGGEERDEAGGSAGLLGPGLTDGNEPVNLTAARLEVSRDGERGEFSGGVRVWEAGSMLQAEKLRFDRAAGTVTASGPGAAGVRTTILSPRGGRMAAGQSRLEAGQFTNAEGSKRAATRKGRRRRADWPVAVEVKASVLHYWRGKELAEYSGGVVVDAEATVVRCKYLKIEWARLDAPPARLVAGGGVLAQQPGRQARGRTAVWDQQRQVLTLSGGSPSIYDAELGFLAGSTLTFSPVNDTIRVESGPGTRTFAAYRTGH